MKISRKMKKLFVAFLAATLSIVMVVTSAGAINAQTCSYWVEHEDFDAFVQMTWYDDSDELQLSVDLTCYEDTNIANVSVALEVIIFYNIFTGPDLTMDYERTTHSDTFSPDATWDSDEIIIDFTNFERGCAYSETNSIDIEVEIICNITYTDGSPDETVNNYSDLCTKNSHFSSPFATLTRFAPVFSARVIE